MRFHTIGCSSARHLFLLDLIYKIMGTIGGIPVACPYPEPQVQNVPSQSAPTANYNSVNMVSLNNLNKITVSAQSQVVDRDPISPGIQSRPGVIRSVGQPQVIGQTGNRPVVVNGNVRPTYR